MGTPCGFDALKGLLHRWIALLPDHRKPGPTTRDRIQDAAWGACGIFCTPSPSFLEYQRPLPQTQGQNNAWTLFGVEPMPCHKQRRTLLDPLLPRHRAGVSLAVLQGLEKHGALPHLRVLSEQLLMARDGTQDFSSNTMHCPHCLRRQPSSGQTRYDHTAITPVSVCPGRAEVIALPPECIRPQDGHDKQDGERGAAKRGLDQPAQQVAPYGITWLGDALYRHHPLCQLARENGCNCLCVCTPDAHATRYDRLPFWQANHALKALETRRREGRFPAGTR